MPSELQQFPNEEKHSLSYSDTDLTYIALYCKCRTTCIGVAYSKEEIEEVWVFHLIRSGDYYAMTKEEIMRGIK